MTPSTEAVSRPLAGAHEIAGLLGVSTTRVHQLRREPGFPPPLDHLVSGRIWRHADVVQWAREQGRLA